MLDSLLLLSGNDIPFSKAKLVIHQPTIKEIAYIGEESFFVGCEMLNFSKNILSDEDKSHLINISNFDVFMSIMKDKKTLAVQKNKACAKMVLSLIFPNYQIAVEKDCLSFKSDDGQEGKIDNSNFEDFKEILVQMFCLKRTKEEEYNPNNEASRKIAEKLAAGRRKAAQAKADAKGESKKISLLSRYVSILAVGQQQTINDMMQYTVYQIFDEIERFELKTDFDVNLEARLAGAKDLKKAENWMKEIHS